MAFKKRVDANIDTVISAIEEALETANSAGEDIGEVGIAAQKEFSSTSG